MCGGESALDGRQSIEKLKTLTETNQDNDTTPSRYLNKVTPLSHKSHCRYQSTAIRVPI